MTTRWGVSIFVAAMIAAWAPSLPPHFQPAPTTAPETASSTPAAPKAAETPEQGAKAKKRARKEKFPHDGFVLDARLGTIGCIGKLCRRHDATPGFRVDGFIGGNLGGIVDAGITGGYGMLGAQMEPGTGALSLYGVDYRDLPAEVQPFIDPRRFAVQDVRLDTAQLGLDFRVHFIPRGRVDAYVGTGIGYNLFRAHYRTAMGTTRLGFHGLFVPIQAGALWYAHPNIAIGAQFDWLYTWYGIVSMRGAGGDLEAPVARLGEEAETVDTELPGDLPQFWTVGGVLHLRFGGRSSRR